MCGIAGCVAARGTTPDRAALDRMARALEHRGPDGDGTCVEGNVGLVHRRLAIVDPTPAGDQPMSDAAGRWLVTYNGEVFNHMELRAGLPGVPWRGHSDTETLVEALAAWDDAAIPRCNGLYAYAALDRRRGRLLLVRDRFGVKPLYVARHGGALWFGSEIRALQAAGVPARPSVARLEHALERSWLNGPWTLLEDVHRVLPGTVLEVDLATLATRERVWYEPAAQVDEGLQGRLEGLDRAAATDEVERALRTAVRRRLMADVPVGTMCSGGVDSGLITAFAREEHPEIHAFNASVSDQPEADESPFAAIVAEHLGVHLHTVPMTGDTFCDDLVEVVGHVEYPLNHESSVPMSQIAGLARSRGVKVLLSGEGADELHAEDRDAIARPRSPERLARRLGRRALRRGPRDEVAGIGLVEEVNAYELALVERGLRAYANHPGPAGRLEGRLVGDLGTYLPHLLNRQDKTTMLRSIETRVPFLDPDLVAVALNLPLGVRAFPENKGVLRDLSNRHLPAAIARRPKVGFGFDAPAYIDARARAEVLLDGRLRDVLGVPREAWAERAASLTGQPRLLAWTAEIWCRLIVDGTPVASVERDLWR
jgi:asparagine synthase (glutamine-hydrolysing)